MGGRAVLFCFCRRYRRDGEPISTIEGTPRTKESHSGGLSVCMCVPALSISGGHRAERS